MAQVSHSPFSLVLTFLYFDRYLNTILYEYFLETSVFMSSLFTLVVMMTARKFTNSVAYVL